MSPLVEALLLAAMAGGSIPLGGYLASLEELLPRWGKNEFHHSVIAFGGGALFSAVGLVLVPEGAKYLPTWGSCLSFVSGGICFYWLDGVISKREGAGAQLVAMLLDFVPEAVAMGASFALGESTGVLLAFLIAIQNIPEAFNAYREIKSSSAISTEKILWSFAALALLGPLASWLGLSYFAEHRSMLGTLMLFSAGGILYLIFEDIAPQAVLKETRTPPLGAVLGFVLGLLGALLTAY